MQLACETAVLTLQSTMSTTVSKQPSAWFESVCLLAVWSTRHAGKASPPRTERAPRHSQQIFLPGEAKHLDFLRGCLAGADFQI